MANKSIGLNRAEKENVHKFILLIKQQGIKVSQVLLFGSYAKGKKNSNSDIDLAVISPQFGRDAISEMMLLRKLAVRVDSHLEPVPLSPAGLKDRYSTLSSEIRHHGIAVE